MGIFLFIVISPFAFLGMGLLGLIISTAIRSIHKNASEFFIGATSAAIIGAIGGIFSNATSYVWANIIIGAVVGAFIGLFGWSVFEKRGWI